MDNRQRYTAEQVYNLLLDTDNITTVEGQIRFYLGDVNIIVKQKDVVGNIIQEWLEGWLEHKNIWYSSNPNTQMPPDIFLDSDMTRNLLEVKAFNRNASPGFDIADFKAYAREIVVKPYMLHTKYLIFGYNMDDNGVVTIMDLWLKNVWEICRSSQQWPINVQYKNHQIHKIRPATWYGNSSRYPTFLCLEDYLSAIEETLFLYSETHVLANDWRRRMREAYQNHYGMSIDIPRWSEIESRYRL